MEEEYGEEGENDMMDKLRKQADDMKGDYGDEEYNSEEDISPEQIKEMQKVFKKQ